MVGFVLVVLKIMEMTMMAEKIKESTNVTISLSKINSGWEDTGKRKKKHV